jgi:hypothetical protein
MDPIINKVAESGIITLDLAELVNREPASELDISVFLSEGLILREKEFRTRLTETDWSQYAGRWVGVYCSTDAIIQKWAWMLIVKQLYPFTDRILFSNPDDLKEKILLEKIQQLDVTPYVDGRVVIKGCGEKFVTGDAYLQISRRLIPVVKNLMYGEPCSTVPVYKKK